MRAQFIYEKFEEETDPIADLGIGGITLSKHFERRHKLIERDIKKIKDNANKKWEAYLKKLFIGKTITAEMVELSQFDNNTGKMTHSGGRGKFTIKVVDIVAKTLEHEYDNSIILSSDDQNIYSLSFDKKIYIQ